MKVTKLDAAVAQLDTAIDLFFSEGNEIATHTLTGAAFSLLRDLLAHEGKTEFFESNIVPARRSEMRRILNQPQNFLKHADRDPEETLDLNEKQTELLLFLAAIQVEFLQAKSDRAVAYLFWFSINYPDVLSESPLKTAALNWEHQYGLTPKSEIYNQVLELAPAARSAYSESQSAGA